jgi:XTP/dITP diphosphohydrolase
MLHPPESASSPGAAFERLVKIVDDLRENCPWDKKQTLESLRYLTIEETYELGDAILENDLKGISEELGDLIMHMIFYARIGKEKDAFTITDSLNGISEKLIGRHPHVYGDVEVSGEEEVKKNWENIKLQEGKRSVLAGVPSSLPALVKAMRIQEKVKQVGFDWEEREAVWDKVQEEKQEFLEASRNNDQEQMELEFGDLLFSLVNYARFVGIDPESALERTNKKFMGRFRIMEEQVLDSGKSLKDLSLGEMEDIWQAAKGA